MIAVEDLTKRYGQTIALDSLGFTVRPGVVTGFLGPNGAGKSTTMRVIAGLDRPPSGRALVDGRPYVEDPAPLRRVGLLLEAKAHTRLGILVIASASAVNGAIVCDPRRR